MFYRPAKFPSVTSLTLFFPASQGADTTRIYYIGFLGQWTEVGSLLTLSIGGPNNLRQRNDKPVIAVYEARANPADHKGIRGIDGSTIAPYDLDSASAQFQRK